MWVKFTGQAFSSWTRRKKKKKKNTRCDNIQKLPVNNFGITTIPDQ